jgi:hypothetical protein
MKKDMLLVRGRGDIAYAHFTDFMLRSARLAMTECNPQSIHITFTDFAPPFFSVIPFKKGRAGMISMYSENGMPEELLEKFAGRCQADIWEDKARIAGAWSVEEAIPVSYRKDWEDQQFTPGVCLLTLFSRKPGLSHEAFLDRWHNSHTPLSLKIHPLWHYSRNVVLGSRLKGSETWEGLVEEHFRKRYQLLNPLVFFGNPFTMYFNMLRVYLDTKAFLDYRTIETYLVREVVMR